MQKQAPISVIILTYNEEMNIEVCLQTVVGWAQDVYVVDSFSTDRTVQVARQYTTLVFQNKWVSFAKQREWAVNHLTLQTEWVFFLDADERMTEEMRKEITHLFTRDSVRENGFYIKRRFFFLNRWLKHGGYYPTPELRMMRCSQVRFVDEGGGARERFLVAGNCGMLKSDMLHIYDKGITEWITKHVKLARLEAAENLTDQQEDLGPQVIGHVGSVSWLRAKVWIRLPRSIRPILLFFYRYILRLGFLDGLQGYYYCTLHDLFYPLLVEVLYFEEKLKREKKDRR